MQSRSITSVLRGLALILAVSPFASLAQDITFHKDIEPILQRSCQNCHRADGRWTDAFSDL